MPAATLGTLLDYLPAESVFLLCEPELLDERAEEYAQQVPEDDPFFVGWSELQEQAAAKGMTILELMDADLALIAPPEDSAAETAAEVPCPPGPALPAKGSEEGSTAVEPPDGNRGAASALGLPFQSIEAYRPLPERAPEPQVAEAQRREFFAQLHRWLRQGYAVHVFCNNDGERQRFAEIWEEYGLAQSRSPLSDSPQSEQRAQPSALEPGLCTHLGTLARGFLCDEAKAGRGHRRGDLWALQGAAPAPAQIAARAGHALGAGH